jgi:hypothetical protein
MKKEKISTAPEKDGNTEKQHICQRSITPLQVFNTLNL